MPPKPAPMIATLGAASGSRIGPSHWAGLARPIRERAPGPDVIERRGEVGHRLVRLTQQPCTELEVVPHALEAGVPDVDARCVGALGEQVGVAQQQVVSADLDVGGRQAVQVGFDRAELRVARVRPAAVELAAVDRPVPKEPDIALGVQGHRRARAGQVEPAVDDREPCRLGLAALTQAHRQRERQTTACRVAGDHDRLRVDPRGEQLSVGGEGVIEPGRVLVLRAEAVFEQVDGGVPRQRDLRRHATVGSAGADDVGAAVQVEDRPPLTAIGRADSVAGNAAEGTLGDRESGWNPGDPGRSLRPPALGPNRDPGALDGALQQARQRPCDGPGQIPGHEPGE